MNSRHPCPRRVCTGGPRCGIRVASASCGHRIPEPALCDRRLVLMRRHRVCELLTPPEPSPNPPLAPGGDPESQGVGLGGLGWGRVGGLRPPTHPQKSAFGLRVDKAYSGHGFWGRFFEESGTRWKIWGHSDHPEKRNFDADLSG